MSRPLDPEHTDSIALSLRITRPLADALDAELVRFTAANPGVSASRATIARIALMRAFLPTGARTSSPEAPPAAATPGTAPSAPEVPAVAAPAAPPPAARAERVERAPRVVSAVASAPVVDPRQLAIPVTAANDAPVSGGTLAHAALHDRYTDVRDRLHVTHADATRALAAAGVPIKDIHREMVKPTAKWTPAHADALTAWLDTIETSGVPAPSEPAAAPRRARAEAVATPENESLRARYTAALAAKRLTNKPTAPRVGCSEATLHQWQAGTIKNLGGDKDPEGKWLANLASILDALPPSLG